MDESRRRTDVFVTPVGEQQRVTQSTDVVMLRRGSDGRVHGSRRVASTSADADSDAVAAIEAAAEQTRSHALARWGSLPWAALQSVVVRAVHNDGPTGPVGHLRALARVDTAAGPVILTTVRSLAGADDAADRVVATSDGRGTRPDGDGPQRREEPPARLRERPLLLRPAVAAIVVHGAWLALTSRSARDARARLAGRRVLPSLTLLDQPAVHRVGAVDDAGDQAAPIELVRDGTLGGAEPSAAVPGLVGRAVWDHDSGGLRAAAEPFLEVVHPTERSPGDEAVELVWCVEGLQRYHVGGQLRLRCLARVVGTDRWFVAEIRGKPLALLRGVRGVTGPASAVYADGIVRTRTLVLSQVATLEEHGYGQVHA